MAGAAPDAAGARPDRAMRAGAAGLCAAAAPAGPAHRMVQRRPWPVPDGAGRPVPGPTAARGAQLALPDRKSTRLNSSHSQISYAVFCLKKKTFTELLDAQHLVF